MGLHSDDILVVSKFAFYQHFNHHPQLSISISTYNSLVTYFYIPTPISIYSKLMVDDDDKRYTKSVYSRLFALRVCC